MAAEKPSEEQESKEEPTAQAEPEQEASAEEPAKPKPRRRAKPKADAKSDTEATKAAAKGDAEASEEPEAAKKPRRSRAKKPAAETSAEAAAEGDEKAEGDEQAAEDEASEKPKPRRRSRAAAAETSEQEPEPAPAPAPVVRSRGSVRVVRAQAKYVHTSARKARLVCDHLRGKSVDEARAILAFNPRGVARDWSKVLESAVSNAENNHELLVEDLVVREAFADEGPTIKRFQPRARGRASSIRKRTSHLTITLAPDWRE